MLVAAGAVFGIALARSLWRRVSFRDGGTSASVEILFQSLPTIAVALLGLTVSLPGSPRTGIVALWGLLLGGEAVGWWTWSRDRARRPTLRPRKGEDRDSAISLRGERAPRASDRGRAARPLDAGEEELLAPGELQRITRVQEAGGEVVYGLVRCEFSPGQRQKNVHVAFCPPLEYRPVLTADHVAGPDSHVKPALVETLSRVSRGAARRS